MANKDQKVLNLNRSGLFFEDLCAHLLRESYLIRAIKTEVPFHNSLTDGVADIIGVASSDRDMEDLYDIIFVFECKKVNPGTKNWVFAHGYENKHLTTYDNPNYLMRVRDRENVKQPQRQQLSARIFSHYAPIVNRGFELRDSDGNLNKDQSLKIFSALSQVNRATSAVLEHNLLANGLFRLPIANTPTYVIPVILTNSILEIISYDDISSVSVDTGEVDPMRTNFKEVGWLWNETPLQSIETLFMDQTGEVAYKRMVPIVNINALEEFLKAIAILVDNYKDA